MDGAQADIDREFQSITHRIRHGPHRFGVLHTRTREFGRALHLWAFCHFTWRRAREYSRILTDFRP